MENRTISPRSLRRIRNDRQSSFSSSTLPKLDSDDSRSRWKRFKALYDHMGLFDMIAEFPPAGVHEKFLREWALATAYVEGKVFECWRSLESSIKGSLVSEASNPQEDALVEVLDQLVENLLVRKVLDVFFDIL